MTFDGNRTPRAALGLIGMAMAAITMGALVVLPAALEAAGGEASVVTTDGMAAYNVAAGAGNVREEDFDARVSRGLNCNYTKDRS